MTNPDHPATLDTHRVLVRCLIFGYLLLAVFYWLSGHVTGLNALWLTVATIGLSLPAMTALWYHSIVRRLVSLHQFDSSRCFYWWGSRRAIAFLSRGLVAFGLTASVLVQSVLLNAWEWALLSSLPVAYLLLRSGVGAATRQQFSHPVYAHRWVLWASEVLLLIVFSLAWVSLRLWFDPGSGKPFADHLYELQATWSAAPSGIAKWLLDGAAWGHVAIESIGDASGQASWKIALALIVTPVSVFGFWALTLSAISQPVSEFRRIFGERLSVEPALGALGLSQTVVWSMTATVCVLLAAYLAGTTDARLKRADSPFAVRPLPHCERIGGNVYQVNTIKLIKEYWAAATKRQAGAQAQACERLDALERESQRGVDVYLDWYFSLGAEWGRLGKMLTGDVDKYLGKKLQEIALSTKEMRSLLEGVQADFNEQWTMSIATPNELLQLLEKNRLVISENQCKVVNEIAGAPTVEKFDNLRIRLAAGATTGVVAATFSGVVAAKALSKAGMKSAAKALSKVLAKKAASKLATAAAGAAAGAKLGAAIGSAAPGPGTAVGAVVGAVGGLAIGAAVDMGMLAAEERLTREDMRRDLLESIRESVEPHRRTFGCS